MKAKKIFSCLFVLSFGLAGIFAETDKLVKPQKPYDPEAPFLMHNWGVCWSRVTRIQTKTDRSNFVWQDDLVGLYYSVQTGNLPVNLILSAEVMYPYHYEFNKVAQISKQIILYSFNFNLGPIWTVPLFDVAKLDLAPMVHYRYQLSDKYHHNEIGLGAFVGFEFPVTKKISILLNGEFTYDLGNLGTNSKVQPFDHVFSYNAQLGCRISNRGKNSFYYIKDKEAKEIARQRAAERQQEQEAKKQEQEAKKQQKEEMKAQYKKDLEEYKQAKKTQKAEKARTRAEAKGE